MNLERLFEQVLREIEITKQSLTQALYHFFQKNVNQNVKLLPNNFIPSLVSDVVKRLLADDKQFCNDQGFILIPSEGSRLINGATELQIKSFIDITIELCTNKADYILKTNKNLKDFQKVFIESFSNSSSNPSWKKEFSDHLTEQIKISKPFYIKVPTTLNQS